MIDVLVLTRNAQLGGSRTAQKEWKNDDATTRMQQVKGD